MGKPLLLFVRAWALFVTAVLLLTGTACVWSGDDSNSEASGVTLSWAKSKHSSINHSGSGYTVYYSKNAGVQPDGAGVIAVDVPYDPDLGKTPTTVSIEKLTTGRWYFRVQAYSNLITSRGTEQLSSALSPESSFKAP